MPGPVRPLEACLSVYLGCTIQYNTAQHSTLPGLEDTDRWVVTPT